MVPSFSGPVTLLLCLHFSPGLHNDSGGRCSSHVMHRQPQHWIQELKLSSADFFREINCCCMYLQVLATKWVTERLRVLNS